MCLTKKFYNINLEFKMEEAQKIRKLIEAIESVNESDGFMGAARRTSDFTSKEIERVAKLVFQKQLPIKKLLQSLNFSVIKIYLILERKSEN